MARAPVATYRLQLGPSVTFRHAQSLTSYLAALGITDLYCSPVLTAAPGSTHGYDIGNHAELNPELGTRDDFRALAGELNGRGMGLILDFVPNHMGIDPRTNAWWRDVLENGPSSPYARFFDIDWLPVKSELRDKVLLPILGDQYGRVLERGELQLAFVEGALVLHYFDRTLPINPRQAPLVLGHGIESLAERLGSDDADLIELRSILSMLTGLPSMSETNETAIAERQRSKEIARQRLAALVERAPAIDDHVRAAMCAFNGVSADAASFDLLHGLLEVQAYRLAYWRTAFDEINYRRFFDVNDLAGLRMEDPRVFAATHALLLELIEEGLVTGIRIDHPDGLFDPTAYLRSLHAAVSERYFARGMPPWDATGGDSERAPNLAQLKSSEGSRDHEWLPHAAGANDLPIYTVVEKVLARGEQLHENWHVHGTTGYGFLNVVNGLFVHPEGLADLRRTYRRLANFRSRPADTVYGAKRFMMLSAMASELNVLTRALNRLSESDRASRDFTLNSLRRALTEVIACFPVYRTYVSEEGASAQDITFVDTAIEEARRRNPVQEPSIFEFIRHCLLPPAVVGDANNDRSRDRNLAFAQKFQQYTAPVVAKGIEDTAFYMDVLLLSANEVGADLRRRTRSAAEFHSDNAHRLARWPLEMTAGSTHDSKRGEDARARINVLSELAGDWRTQLRQWISITESARVTLNGVAAPDRNDEWLLYQTLIGAWPPELPDTEVPQAAPSAFVERIQGYMRKALKEAKRHTSWLHENVAYEQAMETFVRALLAGKYAPQFLASFVPFQRRVAWFGMINSLAQLVLRVGSPGVPDVYQGSELWNLSLVDPDNRQPVDFASRRHSLSQLQPLIESDGPAPAETLRDLFEQWPDGRIKLYTLAKALRLRRAHPDLFLSGEYEPLASDEDPHLIGFSRRHQRDEVIVMAPRFVATMLRGVPRSPFGMDRWRTASVRLPRRLASARLANIFTGETIEPVVHRGVPWLLAGSAFQSWPVAILHCVIE